MNQIAEGVESTTDEKKPSIFKKYKWPIIGVLSLIVGLLVGWALLNLLVPYEYHGTYLQSPGQENDFTLTGPMGEDVSLSDFRGKVVLLYFGYTFCPDVCPATLVELKKAFEVLGKDAEKAQVIMISVDPLRDTPEKLEEYMNHFNTSFIGLTGSEEDIAKVATPLGIFYEKHEGTAATGYLVDHTASVLVIDPDGYLRLIYPFGTPGKDIGEDIKHLVN